MPRWKALPEELDPQIREFTSQLRRLVDRSGLSVAAVADRTGYSKTSWERYLGGRLLAPKGAIVALAEVTGTNPVHLTTMWELAERAWSRSEMRHDMTMEAIRISQARAALSEFGPPPANAKGKTARRGGSATATPGIAGPAGVAPTVPAQPTASDADARTPSAGQRATGGNSWGMAGYAGPSPAGGRRPGAAAGGAGARGAGAGAVTGGGAGAGAAGAGSGGRASGGASTAPAAPAGGGKRRTGMFLAGVAGVLVVAAGAFWVTNGAGGDGGTGAKASPSPTVTTDAALPPGVKCSGDGCTGKDAESMGCSGELVTTAQTALVGTTVVEVRYSRTCGAAWGRITQAAQGDRVEVSTGRSRQQGSVTVAGDTIAYTPMVAVEDAGEANACVTLASGEKGCTQQP
ncbi:helix-turn-helix domain-containing protein [Streptomyces sp.]|uniref:helix-turn-helix domain-containing protein n=1 Tax=Streptomyces sp. TaxID=1931 RepID=UPI002D4C098E|nr:DUF2690 domain-containing protein [Streptomyces sp.]HZF90893.1 DUF2690 domain-containing protein [Streptomyces sp.]